MLQVALENTLFRRYLKEKVSAAFFQAQCRVQPPIIIETERLDFFEKTYNVHILLEPKTTNNGRIVKELKICQKDRATTKAIALFQGTNALIDEHKIENACLLAEKHRDYEIYMRHYPGAGEGRVTIFSTNDITDDSVEFLKRLAKHYDIVYVKAISMGAAIASFSVAECHRIGYKNVYGLFARTYSSFALLLASRVSCPEISYPFFKLLLMFTDFDFTPVKHYLEIPETNKYAYRVEGDTVIPKSASLVEYPEVRSKDLKQKMYYNANSHYFKNIAFYNHRSVFKPVEGQPKDPHGISEGKVYFVENDDAHITAENVGDLYVKYIEHHKNHGI